MSNRLSLIALSRILRVEATSFRIDKRNLLEARVIFTTYNDHVRLLSPEPWLVSATKVYSGVGADIVMESFHQQPGRATGFSRLLCLRFCGRRERASTKESTGRNSGSKVPHFPPQ